MPLSIRFGRSGASSLTRTTNLPATSAFTMMARVFLRSFGTDMAVLAHGHATDASDYYVFYITAGGTTGLWNGSNAIGGSTLALNRWYHLALVVDGTSGANMLAYVDGAVDLANDARVITAQKLWFGDDSESGPIDASMGAIKIWNRALSAAEIATEAAFSAAMNRNALVAELALPSEWDRIRRAGLVPKSATTRWADSSGVGPEFTENGTLDTDVGPPIRYAPPQPRRLRFALASGNVSVLASGVGGTPAVHAPTITASALVALTGVSATAAVTAPTVVPSVAVSLAGVAATAAIGGPSVTAGASVALAGVAATSAVQAPTVLPSVDVVLAGVQAAAAVNAPTVNAGASASPAGVAASAAVHAPTVVPSIDVGLTGVQAAAAVHAPSVTAAAQIALAGVSATDAVGSMSVSSGGDVVASPAGVAAAAAVHGASITGEANAALVGVAGQSNVGALAIVIDAIVALAGVQAGAHVGTLSAACAATVSLPGVNANATVSAGFVQANATITLIGQRAAAAVSAPAVTADALLMLAGLRAASGVGAVNVGAARTTILRDLVALTPPVRLHPLGKPPTLSEFT